MLNKMCVLEQKQHIQQLLRKLENNCVSYKKRLNDFTFQFFNPMLI